MSRLVDLAAEISAARLANEAAIVHVIDVHEAVALANHLTTTGRDYWFRGQTKNWPKLSATYYRLDQKAKEAALQRLQRFVNWTKATPGLEPLAASYDAMIAVAQHYGLPTTFLDFTTDPAVAGFFASVDTRPVEQGTEGCIYCLDLAVADHIWQTVQSALGPEHAVERLIMPVPNLWRLEAQRGVFVWSQYEDLNTPFPLDRIVFPYTEPVASPLLDEIYPLRESPLEARLREYFQNEEIATGTRWLNEELSAAPGVAFNELSFESPSFEPDFFLKKPTPHASWQPDRIAPWLQIRVEPWHALATATPLHFVIQENETPADCSNRLRLYVKSQLDPDKTDRDKTGRDKTERDKLSREIIGPDEIDPDKVDPDKIDPDKVYPDKIDGFSKLRLSPVTWTLTQPHTDPEDTLALSLQTIWDEMARLPWTDEALIAALAAAILWALTARQLAATFQFRSEIERAAAKDLLNQPIRVEIGGHNNAHNWAWLEQSDLLAAIREDFPGLLRPEVRDRVLGDTFNSMMVARTPALLFDFDRLSTLFPATMIPTQAVFHPRHPLFATPARAQIIGPE